MDEDNKRFVNDIITKMKGVKHLAKRNVQLTNTKSDLHGKLHDMVRFLNEDVVGASTSSLIRTDIQIGPDEPTYNNQIQKRMLTINHHGFGTIKNGGSWGTSVSNILRTDEFMKHIFDKDIQSKLLVFLAKNNNKKMLAVCTEMFSKIDILDGIQEISKKYDDKITVQSFDNEVEIAVPSITNDGGEPVAMVKQMTIKTLVSKSSDSFYLFVPSASDKDFKAVNEYRYTRYNDEDEDKKSVTIDLDAMEGVMVMTQIVDELDKAFDDINTKMDTDITKCKDVEEQLNREFSMFKLAKEFKTE